eukprot:TRINITY_DN24699_c0_g2_i1.p1 TRINITY_DN24699_c0_g2~~TRINITY_DN24699_c0_g2_i1.p1  ORF type:complete len:854 (-),score=169.38 TRINITY_DN24699_c0_g2_i1:67-2628(-)
MDLRLSQKRPLGLAPGLSAALAKRALTAAQPANSILGSDSSLSSLWSSSLSSAGAAGQSGADGSVLARVAAMAVAGAEAGVLQTSLLEIPADKIATVIGQDCSMLKALKTVTGTTCTVQHTVGDKAVLVMSGQAEGILKARNLVKALLAQQPGQVSVPTPSSATAGSVSSQLSNAVASKAPPLTAPSAGQTYGVTVLPGAGGLTSQLLVAMPQAESSVEKADAPPAFDKEALARLAKQAQNSPAEILAAPDNSDAPSEDAPAEVQPDIQPTTNSTPMFSAASVEAEPKAETLRPVFLSQEVAAPKKDASAVLGLLRNVQVNVTAGLTGRPRMQATSSKQVDARGAQTPSRESALPSLEALSAKLREFSSSASSLQSSEDRRALAKEVMTNMPSLDPSQVAQLFAQVHEVQALRSSGLLDEVCQLVGPAVSRFRSTDLAKVVSTAANWAAEECRGRSERNDDKQMKISEDVKTFFNSVVAEVSMRLMQLAAFDLARISSALVSVNFATPKFFSSFARAVVAKSDRLSPEELVALVKSFDSAGYFTSGVFEALVRSLTRSVKDIALPELCRGMHSLAVAGMRDDDLGDAVAKDVPARATAGSLSAEDLCSLAWSFCALELHSDQLFRAVFRALEDNSVVANQTLCELYEIHLTLKGFHQESYTLYELEDATVRSLSSHYRVHRKDHVDKMERSSERLHSQIADLLKDIVDGSVATQYQTSLGFPVDIAVLRRKGSTSMPLVCIDVDGPHTMVRSLDPADNLTQRVKGAVALKRRLLPKHGFKLLVISEDHWQALTGVDKKKDLLRKILIQAGVGKERLRDLDPPPKRRRRRHRIRSGRSCSYSDSREPSRSLPRR